MSASRVDVVLAVLRQVEADGRVRVEVRVPADSPSSVFADPDSVREPLAEVARTRHAPWRERIEPQGLLETQSFATLVSAVRILAGRRIHPADDLVVQRWHEWIGDQPAAAFGASQRRQPRTAHEWILALTR